MSKKRRAFNNEKKFRIVLEAIKGQRQISEIAAEYQVHPNQITTWKKQFLEHGAEVFSKKTDKKAEQLEETQGELFKKIGHQQYEIDWLKKNLNRLESWKNEK
ncbi:MAG: transposase [Spirochaetia bacterium]|nr:transposase [Spirochaetia bacterium]